MHLALSSWIEHGRNSERRANRVWVYREQGCISVRVETAVRKLGQGQWHVLSQCSWRRKVPSKQLEEAVHTKNECKAVSDLWNWWLSNQCVRALFYLFWVAFFSSEARLGLDLIAFDTRPCAFDSLVKGGDNIALREEMPFSNILFTTVKHIYIYKK